MKERASKREMEKQERIANLQYQSAKLLEQGYKENIGIMSVLKINIMAFITAGPFAIIAAAIYLAVWNQLSHQDDLLFWLFIVIIVIVSIPVHEFLHGFTWHFFCKEKWKSIRFFVLWEYLTPCCHCKEPLKYSEYILGALMPFFVLGIGVTALGIAFHSPLLLFAGILNILSAGGDTTIVCMAFPYRGSLIIDHPTECGFIAYQK